MDLLPPLERGEVEEVLMGEEILVAPPVELQEEMVVGEDLGKEVVLEGILEETVEGEEEEEDDEEIYEVDCIVQDRVRKGVKEYLVKWKGFGEDYDTWEPEDNLNCDEIIAEYINQKERKAKGGRGRKRGRSRGDEEEDEFDLDELIEEPPARRRKKAKKTPPKRKTPSNKPPPLIIKCKTIFKKHMIQKCIKCEDRREPEDDTSPDMITKYFLRYDIDTDQFFVGDVRVEVDEEKKCIMCTACTKVFGDLTLEQKLTPGKGPLQFWQMCREMKLHIIGRHLGGFTCYLCDEPYQFHTRGATHFYRHMGMFHKDREGADKDQGIDNLLGEEDDEEDDDKPENEQESQKNSTST